MNQIKVGTLTVYKTEDLSIFQIMKQNREPNMIQVKRLARIIKQKNITELSPILVNENYEIVDGQHRFWATRLVAEETGTPQTIYFIVREGIGAAEAMQLNAGSKPWGPDDYAKYHSKLGNKNYTTFLNFRDRYELNADVLMKYLSPSDGNRMEFQKGEFVVENEEKTKTWCNKLETMKIYYQDFKHRSFALAFLELVSHKKYVHTRMVEQLESYASDLIRIPLKNKPMKEALIEIYNKRVSEKELFN